MKGLLVSEFIKLIETQKSVSHESLILYSNAWELNPHLSKVKDIHFAIKEEMKVKNNVIDDLVQVENVSNMKIPKHLKAKLKNL